MGSELLQFLFAGLTTGAVYALVALGFTLIYAASDVVNFAQGEFVMLGGMTTVALIGLGLPLPVAAVLAVLATVLVGLALHRLAIRPAQAGGAPVVTLIIVTIGASIALRGLAQLLFDRQLHKLPAFSGEAPVRVLGATILPQSFWILGGAALILVLLGSFLGRTLAGKALLATAQNRLAARLVGIDTEAMVGLAFAVSAGIGAVAGILAAPITFTSFDVGTLLALKGFAAAMLGGIGSPLGALAGGLLLGIVEALAAGYLSSTYKDAVAFLVLFAVLLVLPAGLFGRALRERV